MQLLAGHQACGVGGAGSGGFAPGFGDVDGAALEAVIAVTVLATDPLDAAANQFALKGQYSAGVFEFTRLDVQVAFAFHGAGQVAKARRLTAVGSRETEIATAVDVAFKVAEMLAA